MVLDQSSINDWEYEGKKCSVFDQTGRRVIYWEMSVDEQDIGLLTWNEH